MNLANWLGGSACVRLIQVLGHFLWQGAAIAAIAVLAANLLRRASAQVRYALLVAALLAMAACPPATFVLLPAAGGSAVEPTTSGPPGVAARAPPGSAAPGEAPTPRQPRAPVGQAAAGEHASDDAPAAGARHARSTGPRRRAGITTASPPAGRPHLIRTSPK